MNYLYHMVPDVLKGEKLLPQNLLKIKYPELYKESMKKYKGRKNILNRKIHYLNCYWSDVIFLSPVHPKKIARALKTAGKKSTQKIRFYKINPKKLNPEKIIVYLYKYDTMDQKERKDNFTSFSTKNLSKYNKVPNKTLKYYREEIKQGRRPLLYHLIPHIIYKGSLFIKDTEIIEINF